MRILNIVDTRFLKIVLKKFYLSSNLDYMFIDPFEDYIEVIKTVKPDILVVQDLYEKYKGADIISEVLEEVELFRNISTIILVDNTGESKSENKLLNEIEKINVIPIKDILDKLKFVIYDVTKKIEYEQHKILSIENKKTILFVDDDKFLHHYIDETFKDTNYYIIHGYDGEEGFELYKKYSPSLVITDLEMPKMTGVELCKKIKNDDLGRFIPTIILSGIDNPLDIEKAYNLGASDYLIKPVDSEILINKVNEYFMHFTAKTKEKILIVDDSKMIREILRHAIIKNGMVALTAENGEEALKIIFSEMPEIVITDINMPKMDGYELCSKIKENPDLEHINIIMISSKSTPYDIKIGEHLGVIKYFVKPFDVDKVVLEVEHILIENYKVYKKEYEYMFYTIKALIQALEERDKYTKGHTDRVTDYAIRLAKYMKLDRKTIENIKIAANLHDIGKIGIRDDILYKAEGLSEKEYLIIQEHTLKGVEILKPIVSLKNVLPLILLHHERWDGKGYPTMIKNEEIPVGARIISVADSFDAMTSDRPYRGKKTIQEALEIIKECSGSQLCPVCTKAFIEMILLEEEKKLRAENKE